MMLYCMCCENIFEFEKKTNDITIDITIDITLHIISILVMCHVGPVC